MRDSILDYFEQVTGEERALLEGRKLDRSVYTEGEGFVVDNKKLLEEGRYITIRPHTRFVDFPSHSHNYVEMVYMLRGATTHLIDSSVPLKLEQGELLMMNQHVSHAIQAAGEEDVAVNLIVLPQFFNTALDIIGVDNVLGRFLLGSLQSRGADITYLHFRVADISQVQNLMENLLLGFIDPASNENEVGKVTMGLLLLHLINHTERLDMTGHRQGDALVLECLRDIEQNYLSASLSRIAQKYSVSVTYLSNLVKASAGKTYKQLLQEKRLGRAEELLRGTSLTVQQVIAAVGYQNTSYFYRIFRQRYGVPPTDYRRAC